MTNPTPLESVELLSCPFCGSSASIWKGHRPVCDNFDCGAELSPDEDWTLEQNINAWNHRPTIATLAAPDADKGMEPQLVNSAPKEIYILLFVKEFGWVRGHWHEDKYSKKPRPYWKTDLERIFGILHSRENQPTHWLPMPAAPSIEADKDGA